MNEGDRYRLYQRLLKAAAKQLNCRVTDDKAKDLACLRLMRETVTLKLIAGKDCDPSSLRWLIEELARFSPPPEAKVDIGFVEHVTGIFTCQHCHKRNEIPDHRPRTPPGAPLPGSVSDTAQQEKPATDAAVAKEAAPKEPPPQRFSRSEVDPHYRGELQADPMCPLSFSPNGDSPNNNWSFNDGSAGSHKPFADPNPVFRNGKFRY
jgi:hypothetical protein